jgi:hypothetical protein
MAKNKKFEIKKEIKTSKRFDYYGDETDLGFTLNVDSEKELVEFRQLLKTALEDIEELLYGKIKN